MEALNKAAGDTCNFRGKDSQLLNHRVYDVRGPKELALQRSTLDVERHGLPQIALGHGADRARHFRGGPHQVFDEGIELRNFASPGSHRAGHTHPLFELAFLAHGLADALVLSHPAVVQCSDIVKRLGDPAEHPAPACRQPLRKIPVAKRDHRLENVLRMLAVARDRAVTSNLRGLCAVDG
jgi:hypothetical protein